MINAIVLVKSLEFLPQTKILLTDFQEKYFVRTLIFILVTSD